MEYLSRGGCKPPQWNIFPEGGVYTTSVEYLSTGGGVSTTSVEYLSGGGVYTTLVECLSRGGGVHHLRGIFF